MARLSLMTRKRKQRRQRLIFALWNQVITIVSWFVISLYMLALKHIMEKPHIRYSTAKIDRYAVSGKRKEKSRQRRERMVATAVSEEEKERNRRRWRQCCKTRPRRPSTQQLLVNQTSSSDFHVLGLSQTRSTRAKLGQLGPTRLAVKLGCRCSFPLTSLESIPCLVAYSIVSGVRGETGESSKKRTAEMRDIESEIKEEEGDGENKTTESGFRGTR